MSQARVTLSPVEAAYVQMVLEEHAALVQMADKTRDRRMATLLTEHGIPKGLPVQRVPNPDGTVQLEYEAPA